MKINVLPLGHIGANCYMIYTEKSAVIIDCGFKSDAVTVFLKENGYKERMILLTHGHFDHIGGAESLREETDTKIAVGALDSALLEDTNSNLSDRFHAHLTPFKADILLNDGDVITVGDLTFKVIHTPGHTVGSVCFLCENVLFSGDTLFDGSIGRTDFPGGDFETIKSSIKKLYELDDDIIVLSGHGNRTTIKKEKQHNPYVRG